MNPVFIGGCDRSGTTLLGAMLGAHSECLTVPESQFKIATLMACDHNTIRNDLRSCLNLITGHQRFKLQWCLDIDVASVSMQEIGFSYRELIEWIIKKYATRCGKTRFSLWVDHTPSNLRYAITLLEIFPEAKFINLIRDGRAVASSILPLDWGPNTITKAAAWWIDRAAYGLAAETSVPKAKILRIRYEDLVRDPQETLKKICDYLEIDRQPQMAEANGFKVSRYSARQHALVGKEPDANRINAWEKALTPRQIEIFESLTADFLQYLGYTLRYGLKARGPTRMERFSSTAREAYLEIKNKFHHRYRAFQN